MATKKRSAHAPSLPSLPREQRPPRDVTRELFLAWRAPRIGQHNPHPMTNPVWRWLANNPELNAYMANARFKGPPSHSVGPGFCNMRFGQSRTELADGRVLLIGGEHEDHYDPDFFIYNDVIVRHPSGELDVFGYPQDAFAPTDHHSATLLEDRVLILGGLSYRERRRPGVTLAHSLALGSMAITPTASTGENPGWIFGHSAELSEDRGHVTLRRGSVVEWIDGVDRIVENCDEWTLELATLRWTRSKHVPSQQWEVLRGDGRSHHLFNLRSVRFYLSDGSDWSREQLDKLRAALGREPDVALYDALAEPPIAHDKLPTRDEHPRLRCIVVGGASVRYVEELRALRVVIEGAIDEAIVGQLIEDARQKLGALEGVECVARRLR